MTDNNKYSLALLPWSEIAEIRVVEEGENEGDYIIKGKGEKGKIRAYDLSKLVPEQDPKHPSINPMYMSRENGAGKGWTHKVNGTATSPYLLNPVARRLNKDSHYLILFRLYKDKWAVIGNPYGGEMTIHTGGYTDLSLGEWICTNPLSYEFMCEYQLYPQSPLKGELEILPTEEFFVEQ